MEIYVKVDPKNGLESFCRCGMKFSKKWERVEADEATFRRLDAEQMLKVSKTKPADYVEPEAAKADEKAKAPTDPADRAAAIKDAIGKLDTEDSTLWTTGGMPKIPAIQSVTGWDISQQERDAAWAEINKGAQ